MSKTVIAVQGSLHGADATWANIREIKDIATLKQCENLTIWLSGDIRERDAREALETLRVKYPFFRGNVELHETDKGDLVKMWRDPNGTSLDVLLNLE